MCVCLRLQSLSASWIWMLQLCEVKKNGYTVKNEISLWCCTGRKPVLNSSITLTSPVSTPVSSMNGSTMDHVLIVNRKKKKKLEFRSWRTVICQFFMKSSTAVGKSTLLFKCLGSVGFFQRPTECLERRSIIQCFDNFS